MTIKGQGAQSNNCNQINRTFLEVIPNRLGKLKIVF